VNEMLNNMSTDDNHVLSICANCGKEGANNICAKCQVTKYCNAVCKKVHKKKHKKDCEECIRLATEKHNEELRIAAELHDEQLFKQSPPKEDCPICFLRIPILQTGSTYYSCCGKIICNGCAHAPVYDNQGNEVDNKKCPFCRTPFYESEEEMIKQERKRMEADDPLAVYNLGSYYRDGKYGFRQDYTKALELFHRSGELGYAEAYGNIGITYSLGGRGVEVDKKKGVYYYELAAMAGDEIARNKLGLNETRAGNYDRALKHFMIAVRGGHAKSLEAIKELFTERHASKDDYTEALQLYQEYLGEIKSPQRDKAAAVEKRFRYY